MATNETVLYPAQLDGYSTLPLRKDGVHEIRAADVNRLRNAILAIEYELGIEPSGVFATVRDRLDSVADASAQIAAHIADTVDAHDASAISILDAGDNYVSAEVEGALGELAAVLPIQPDVIGADNTSIPNDGIPDFSDSSGALHVFNTGAGADVLKKTQPVNVLGIHIIEVGEANGAGTGAQLQYEIAPPRLSWKAPGDSFGSTVDISTLVDGDIITLSSSNTAKKIRVARTSATLAAVNQTDTFDILRFDKKSGTYSLTGTGFINTNNATRAAAGATGTTRNQFVIKGTIFPADRGTLVLQRKLRLSTSTFAPIAVLDLSDIFDEDLRTDGQPVYSPTLANYDVITLYDRLPARKDYETLSLDSDGNQVFQNFNLSATFVPFQLAKFMIPISNPTSGISGLLESPTSFSATEIDNKVSAYRLVHYKTGVTDFNGEPDPADILSISDSFAGGNNGDNTVRMSNVFSDSNTTRPTIEQVLLRPVSDTVANTRRSGVDYYDNETFDLELKSGTNAFNNIYIRAGMLTFVTSTFNFPSGVAAGAFGTAVDVDELFDDGYALFSTGNLPIFGDRAFYLINSTFNTARRLTPLTNAYSNNGYITARLHDPFGFTSYDAYGYLLSSATHVRLLVNNFATHRATNTEEWFTDESRRVGTAETFNFALDFDQFTFESGAGSNGTLTDWDHNAALSFGELQCGGRFVELNTPGLVFPQDDYSIVTIRPTQQGGINYSAAGYEIDSTYQRLFSLGRTTNGGRLRIISNSANPLSYNDIDASNTSRPIKIEVKVPGTGSNSTGFMDLGKLFDIGQVDDGDGAVAGLISGGLGDFTVPFTFGVVNTADTGYMIAVRITFFATTAPILANAKSRIITKLELLTQ